jgi:aryl-alcohol dehydrogenase-like predicted oxidoreductase
MGLQTRALGATGMEITRVGFGAWAIGGPGPFAWGSQDDGEAVAAIGHAVESGVNWIDTAAVYGLGHSEELVGRAVAGLPDPDRPYVFTKCGQVWDPDDPGRPVRRVMDPDSVRREVEDSLRRLQVDRIDLYQVHWPPEPVAVEGDVPEGLTVPPLPIQDYWQVVADLRDAGKVRAIGLSNHSVSQLESAEAVAHVDVLQPPFSAINRSAAPEIAWAEGAGTGVIVYSPMQSGLLTGAFSRERVASLPDDDWRSQSDDFTTDLDRNLAVADALVPVAERHGVSPGAVAVAWTLAWPGVTGAIVGARRPDQVDGWIPAADLELTDEDLDEIAAAVERSGAGTGPVRPTEV